MKISVSKSLNSVTLKSSLHLFCKVYLVSFILFFSCLNSFGQKHDYHWLVGFDHNLNNPLDSTLGISVLDFNTDSLYPRVYYDGRFKIDFMLTGTTISDQNGKFLFAYNGRYIENAAGNTMENASGLNPSGQVNAGDVLINGGLAIPIYGDENIYYLFHQSWTSTTEDPRFSYVSDLFLSVIDMSKSNGLGSVFSRREVVLQDTMDNGKMSATRHSNGRDWWLLVPKHSTNEFFTFLISPTGIDTAFTQSTGIIRPGHIGQTVFSPDGSKLAIMNINEIQPIHSAYMDLFDFDRCTGLLSFHQQRLIPSRSSIAAGTAFSPSGRFLYVSRTDTIYQVDVTIDSLILDPVAVFNYDTSACNLAYPWFGIMQLGPDGRIYIASNNSLVCEMHVIQYPDRAGEACQVRQLGLRTPTQHLTLPQFPHYRTGPEDGSTCDTLGLDNLPKALFRSDIKYTEHHINFTNASYYEPHTWYWDFGDGNISAEQHPEHTYAAPGLYEVCLTASNDYGTDTWCRMIDLNTTSTAGSVKPHSHITLQPNPATDQAWLVIRDYIPSHAHIRVYDMQGRLMMQCPIGGSFSRLGIADLPSGMYYWRVSEGEFILGMGKLIKM